MLQNIWESSSGIDMPVQISSPIRTSVFTSARSASVVPFIFMFLMQVYDVFCFDTCKK
jgi:hypothetical protein